MNLIKASQSYIAIEIKNREKEDKLKSLTKILEGFNIMTKAGIGDNHKVSTINIKILNSTNYILFIEILDKIELQDNLSINSIQFRISYNKNIVNFQFQSKLKLNDINMDVKAEKKDNVWSIKSFESNITLSRIISNLGVDTISVPHDFKDLKVSHFIINYDTQNKNYSFSFQVQVQLQEMQCQLTFKLEKKKDNFELKGTFCINHLTLDFLQNLKYDRIVV